MNRKKEGKKYIVDLKLLNANNKNGCGACGNKFNLGDVAVMACGGWSDGCARLIHENEAIYDPRTDIFFERNYFQTRGLNK